MVAKIIKILFGVILVAAVLFAADFVRYINTPIYLADNYVLRVESGNSATTIINQLEQEQIISKPKYLRLLFDLHQATTRIHTGEFIIKNQTTPWQLAQQLINGEVKLYSITFIEGWTLTDCLQALAESKNLQAVELSELQQIFPLQPELEGLFFPDTYFYAKNDPPAAIFKKAQTKLSKLLSEQWRERDPDIKLATPYDALILASIVEKESAINDEKPKVARVFLNRLNKNMPLQADPTVVYALGAKYTGKLYKKDLRINSAYNSYLHKGLPPGPICLPSKSSIAAVMHPDPNKKLLYFVADGSGKHSFTTNLDAHNKAVRAYRNKTKE